MGSKLAGNGTHFKSTVMDTEHMARFIATHHAWLDAHSIANEDIPLRVAREGSWPTAEALVTDLREARRAVLRYVAELECVVAHMMSVFQSLDTAYSSGGSEAVLSVIRVLDKRKRGRNDRLKLPYRKLTEEDQAFARDMLPGHGDNIVDGRRVLSVLHGLRILMWRHTDELFPGTLVLNSPAVLNNRVKWKEGKERGLEAARRIAAELEHCIKNPSSSTWVCAQPLSGAVTMAAEAMRRERAAVPSVTAWRHMPSATVFVEPRSLALEPFCDPAPTQLAGKFTARPNRYPCSVMVNPPAVFELSSGVRTGPLLPRQQGLVVHDSVGQWVHAPGYIKFRHPEVVVDALTAAGARSRPCINMAELIASEAEGFTRVPPSADYAHVAPRRKMGTPFEHISHDATIAECWASRQAHPRDLLRGVLRHAIRGGGRPRKAGTEDTTQHVEESTLAFACWLHYFVETRRGWLVAPKRMPDEETMSLFVLLYDDLGVAGLMQQPAFGPGGVCALDQPSTNQVYTSPLVLGYSDGKTHELGSAQTRSWRTASSGFAELRKAFRNPVRQDRVWAEPSS